MKKLLTLLVAAIMAVACCFGLVACGGGDNDEAANTIKVPEYDSRLIYNGVVDDDFKVGFIFLHDEKSTYDLNFINAAKAACAAYGLKDSQVIMKYNVKESADCTATANELISSGCKAIFADSFGHGAFLPAAANPTVQFFHATGTGTSVDTAPANLHNAFASIYQGRYLAGVVAGMKLDEMITAGKVNPANEIKVGYIGAFTYAEVMSGYTSWYLGVLEGCTLADDSKIKMEVTFTGSWYDVDKEKAGAENLISRGCVLISQHADSMGAPSACEAKGVPNVSYNGSTIASCPDTFLISSRIDWTNYMKAMIGAVATGNAMPTDYTGSIEDGMVVLTDLNAGAFKNPQAVVKKIVELREELVSGARFVFDVSKFTVSGEHLTTYSADVIDNGDYVGDTEAIVTDGVTGITYFNESYDRSAPYFNIEIDGITLLDRNYGD